MRWFIQLKLLVWKNVTLKRRNPFVLILEMFIPLVVFAVVAIVRSQEKTKSFPSSHYAAHPLPSAGILPLLMEIINLPHDDRNTDSVLVRKRVSILLENISDNAVTQNLYDNGELALLTHLRRLEELPQTLQAVVKELLVMPEIIELISKLPLSEIFTNNLAVRNTLVTRFLIPENTANEILKNSLDTLQITDKIFKMLSNKFLNFLSDYSATDEANLQWFSSPLVLKSLIHALLYDNNALPKVDVYNTYQRIFCKKPLVMTDFESNTTFVVSKALCSLNPTQFKNGFLELLKEFDYVKIIRNSNLNISAVLSLIMQPSKILDDLEQFYITLKLLGDISSLFYDFKLGPCPGNHLDSDGTDELIVSNIPNVWNTFKQHILQENISKAVNTSASGTTNDIEVYFKNLLKKSKNEGFLRSHSLNSKILYAPIHTEADKIIHKANETFRLIGLITSLANQFQSTFNGLKDYLKQDADDQMVNVLLEISDQFFNRVQPVTKKPAFKIYKDILKDLYNLEKGSLFSQLEIIQNGACHWISLMSFINLDIFMGFENENAAVDYFKTSYSKNRSVYACIIFDVNQDGSLPKHVTYKIRQSAALTPRTDVIMPPRWNNHYIMPARQYYFSGFAWIQDAIDRAIISFHSNRTVLEPGLYVQQFPRPCSVFDSFLILLQHLIPFCLTTSWVYIVAMTVHSIVYEKENRLKEVMKSMGMTDLIHWLSFFITNVAQYTISIIVLTFIVSWGNIFYKSDWTLLYVLFQIYAIGNFSFSFLISTLFSKAKLAAASAGILYFLCLVPSIYISVNEDHNYSDSSYLLKVIACLFNPTVFLLATKQISFYEKIHEGINWSNWDIPFIDYQFSLRTLILFMIFDIFLYSLLIWYIQNVHPGSYGLPRPWYFPCTKSYWTGTPKKNLNLYLYNNNRSKLKGSDELGMANNSGDESAHSNLFEEDPIHLPVGVIIDNLVKTYKNKTAVNGLSVCFYEGQITSFLGHNGAGKTTTLSMLTGLIPPTAGTAKIYGMDIHNDMDLIRKSMGMCPQHNVLFEELTVEEHLWYYCSLKGMSATDIPSEINMVINDAEMSHKRKQRTDSLPGGMKRRLSVAIAFVGGSRIVILDEPTSGIDPCARRSIWNLILKYKKGRTIILSTHYMDEAEVLGDRIAIISDGQLRCCGTPLFLKTHLGAGYHLHLVKAEYRERQDNENSDTEMALTSHQIEPEPSLYSLCCEKTVTSFIKKIVLSASLEFETPYELHYVLPISELKKGNFEKLFASLDENLPFLKIKSYGVKNTTLEEVFLKLTSSQKSLVEDGVGVAATDVAQSSALSQSDYPLQSMEEISDVFITNNVGKNKTSLKNIFKNKSMYEKIPIEDPESTTDGYSFVQIHGCHLRIMQILAIMKKKYLYTTRNVKGVFAQLILPCIFIGVAMTVALKSLAAFDTKPIEMSTSHYYNFSKDKGHFIPFANYHQDDHTNNSRFDRDATSGRIQDTFKMISGLGATCVISPKGFPMYFEPSCSRINVPEFEMNDITLYSEITTHQSTHSSNNTKFNCSDCVVQGNEESTSHHHYYSECQCPSHMYGFKCQNVSLENPPQFKAITGEILLDISGDNEEDYLLYTNHLYQNTRFGALTLGLKHGPSSQKFDDKTSNILNIIATESFAKVWFNGEAFHAMPVFINVLNNGILRANIPAGQGDPSSYGITTINDPLPGSNSLTDSFILLEGSDILISIFIIVAMSFVPASFILFLVAERSTKCKHLHMVSGVEPLPYWIGNYLWDILNSAIPSFFCILILVMYNIPAYASSTNLPAVIVLFLLYGWSVTPVMYPVSFLFREASTAYVFLIIVNLFVGCTCLFIDAVVKGLIVDEDMVKLYDILQIAFLIFPNYCLGKGLIELSFNELNNEFRIQSGRAQDVVSPWKRDIVPYKLLGMALSGTVFFCITVLLEYRVYRRKRYVVTEAKITGDDEDQDVFSERIRVESGRANGDILKIKNLTKIYHSRKLGDCLAVDNVTLGIRPGECFGLIGTNGAGKTTFFKILTGDLQSSHGDAYLNGYSIFDNFSKVQKMIGYCPQFDSLYDELTAREHLEMYASFRGIISKDRKKVVNHLINKLDLSDYADQRVSTYSGGNRRKLATALSLMGNPSIVFMDEPSTGMDPHTKRFLWNVIIDLTKNNQSVVLTSHSMEECEAICSRLTIMVNGRFRCLGSVQHLKNKYGGGYFVVVRAKTKDVSLILEFIQKVFPNSIIKEKNYNMIQFELHSGTVSLAYIFSCMETALLHLPIVDYSVCQNALDNVFMNLAKRSNSHSLNFDEYIPTENSDGLKLNSDGSDIQLI